MGDISLESDSRVLDKGEYNITVGQTKVIDMGALTILDLTCCAPESCHDYMTKTWTQGCSTFKDAVMPRLETIA